MNREQAATLIRESAKPLRRAAFGGTLQAF